MSTSFAVAASALVGARALVGQRRELGQPALEQLVELGRQAGALHLDLEPRPPVAGLAQLARARLELGDQARARAHHPPDAPQHRGDGREDDERGEADQAVPVRHHRLARDHEGQPGERAAQLEPRGGREGEEEREREDHAAAHELAEQRDVQPEREEHAPPRPRPARRVATGSGRRRARRTARDHQLAAISGSSTFSTMRRTPRAASTSVSATSQIPIEPHPAHHPSPPSPV